MHRNNVAHGMRGGMGPANPRGVPHPNVMKRPGTARPSHTGRASGMAQPVPGSREMYGGMGHGNAPGHRPMPSNPQPQLQQQTRVSQPKPVSNETRYLIIYHSNRVESIQFRDKVYKSPIYQQLTIRSADANDPSVRSRIPNEVRNVPSIIKMKGTNKVIIHPGQVEDWLRNACEQFGPKVDQICAYEADPFSENYCTMDDMDIKLDSKTGPHRRTTRFVGLDEVEHFHINTPEGKMPSKDGRTANKEDGRRRMERPRNTDKYSSDKLNKMQKQYENERENIQVPVHPGALADFPEPQKVRDDRRDMGHIMEQYKREREHGVPKQINRNVIGTDNNPASGMQMSDPINNGFGDHDVKSRFEELKRGRRM